MSEWVRGIFAASLLGAMALALCPPGRVRSVTRLACGLVCALAVASPLFRLDMDGLAAGIAAYQRQAEAITADEDERQKLLERTYIEEQYAAYISSRARQTGADVRSVTVSARWDDDALVWYPHTAAVEGAYSAALSRIIEQELGIPPERQEWIAYE